MADDELVVRLTVVGHASRRWKSAKNAAQADQLNQRLSEVRAHNVRRVVEDIVKRELPTLRIDVPARGVGSHEPFPTAGEDNASVDRSVLVMVELTTTRSSLRSVARPPHKVYVPSRYWTLRVLAMTGAAGVGAKAVFLRIKIRNAVSGREITLSGGLTGGAYDLPIPSNLFSFDKANPSQWGKPIGDEVTFTTKKPMDFDDWIGAGGDNGQMVRVVHAGIKTGVTKHETTFLQFTGIDHHPDMLVFELTTFKWSLGKPANPISAVAGKVTLEGSNPGDFVESPSPSDLVRIQNVHPYYTGLLLSFPTGKADLRDLTNEERTELTDFVTNRARTIAAYARSHKVTNPRP